MGAISSKGTANMSCSTNASRSAGVSVSSTTSSARPTESASSGLVLGIDGVVAEHDRVGHVRAERVLAPRLARAQHVEAHPRDDRRQPAAEVLDVAGVGAAEPDPRLLHGVVGLGARAEHPVRDRPQVGPVRLELLGQPSCLVHRHIPRRVAVIPVTEATRRCDTEDSSSWISQTRRGSQSQAAPGGSAVTSSTCSREQGHEVVPMARATGVDIVTGDGLAAALAGVQCIIDAATWATPDEAAATAFFTAAARNLHEAGQAARRAPRRGVDHRDRPVRGRLHGGEARPRAGHARRPHPGPHRAGRPSSTSSWRNCFDWCTRGDIAYVPNMRTQLVAARTVAEVLADVAVDSAVTLGALLQAPSPARWSTSPATREESLIDMATLLAGRRGHPLKVHDGTDPADPDHRLYRAGALLPGPGAILAGPTFGDWLDAAS